MRAWCLSETGTAFIALARAAFSSTVRLAKSIALICDGHFDCSKAKASAFFSLILRLRELDPACAFLGMRMLKFAGCKDGLRARFCTERHISND